MNKKIFSILFIFLLYLNGCSKESLVGINKDNPSQGSIALKINNNTAPSEVQQLTAYLTRPDYDTLESSIIINNDPLKVLSFENIPVGNWHLAVEAQNSEGKVIYCGESDVSVIEDSIISVYLTLQPVGSGTGNIEIYIDWGSNWKDYYENPILTKGPNISNVYGIIEPKILYENGVYKMWYTKLLSSAAIEIWYTESSDGINWTSQYDKPVIVPGEAGAWDDYSVGVGDIIYEDGKYKMYYNGFQDQYGKWCIGLAVSDDGINWQKNAAPVLIPSEEEYQIIASSVIKLDDQYYMYYSTRNYPYYSICLAMSQDGLNWQKYDQNPILKPLNSWEGTGILFPTVLKRDNKYEMVYMNCNQNLWAFGKAISLNGKDWIKSDSNPFFTALDTFNKWAYKIAYPDYIRINSEYRIYYTGYIGNDEGTVAVVTNE